MHGKCGFGPLNHIAGRVKIVLGKKKADKHTVWAPGEVAASGLPIPIPERGVRAPVHGIRARGGRIFRGGYFQIEEGFLVQKYRNVMPSWLSRKSI